jgi:hypothetical protein
MTNLELDGIGIDTDNYFKNYFNTNETSDVVQQEKDLQHLT